MNARELIATFNPFTYRKEHKQIMTIVEDIQQKVTQLNAAIDSETQQQRDKIAELQVEIDALKAAGNDTAALQKIADDLGASIERVKAIVPDAAPTT